MPRKSKSKKGKRIGRGQGNISQTVKISLGGAGGLDSLYKQLQQKMGGLGQGSSSAYPSSPSYYRLLPPQQSYAQAPDVLSGRNLAVPNNLSSNTLQNPLHGRKDLAERLGEMVQQTKQRVLSKITPGPSSRLLASSPEPNRPISATQSSMVAGRPILSDPSLPRQNPAGRDNAPQPTVAQVGAPDSGFFPQQAQAPVTVAQEQGLQRQIGVKKKSPRPRK